MKDGGRYEDQFVGLLNDELLERAREMKRDGQGRFCANQRDLFRRSGLGRIYPN